MPRPFQSLSRPEQRANLLGRYKRIRREIEQQLRDRAAFNDLQRQRGEEGIGDDPELVALLAQLDRAEQQVRDSH